MNRDLSIRLREARQGMTSRRLRLAAGGRDSARDVTASAAVPQEHPLLRGVEAAPRRRGPEVLTRAQFLEQMEREKRRAERARSAFSMVLFENDQTTAGDVLDLLPGAIAEMKRDTDIVGDLDDRMFAVLLPGTDGGGARCFVDKLVGRQELRGLAASVVTYPDHLFDSLATSEPVAHPLESLAHGAGTRHGPRYAIKRTIDIVGAITGIVLLSPLMLLTAIGVAATSPGPIVFKQVRLGRGGRAFVLYKFRSMFRDADERVHRDYVLGLIAGGEGGNATRAWAKLEGDARVTPLGRFLRKTCVDELPQLFNVLKGDLSLVGPRPPLPYEAAAYESWHLRRVLEIKPGITGLWQVEGRNATTFDEMVRMDLRYVRTWSLPLDLKILCKTAMVIIKRNGVG